MFRRNLRYLCLVGFVTVNISTASGVWFFNDWLRKTTFIYRPPWEGALRQPVIGQWTEFVSRDDALFKPTDIEVGPDGALHILGWGSAMPKYDSLLSAELTADGTSGDDMPSAASPKYQPFDPAAAKFTVSAQKEKVLVRLDDRPWGTYLLKHVDLIRPAWIHVHSQNGIPVTRDFPAAGDDDDHRFMHPGIWISFGNLGGQDYWRLKARTEHVEFVEPPTADGPRASFAVLNRYRSEDGQRTICAETTRYVLTAQSEGVLMTVDAQFKSDNADFYFGDQEESGLAFRMAAPLTVAGGSGTMINSQGDKNGKAIWGQRSKWIDYSGTVDGGGDTRHVGIMAMPHPGNARACWMHARDYGLVAANPFPRQAKEQREPFVKTWVKQGETYRVRYGLLVHDTPHGIDRDKVYAGYLQAVDR